MTDVEVKVEVQLVSHSPAGQEDLSGERNFHAPHKVVVSVQRDDFRSLRVSEAEEPLSLLADVALTPPCGKEEACSCVEDRQAEDRQVEDSLRSIQLQLQFLLSKADDLQDCLLSGRTHLDGEALAAAVPSLLYTCQPYFNHLESKTRSTVSQLPPLPFDMYTRQLLDFSQQLCDRLEQLVLTYASHNLLCVDETEPNSVSHFCIGQSQLGGLKLTTFRYSKPAPYLAQIDTGLYKRMRWNVEKLLDERQRKTDEEQSGEGEAETVGDTEYFFLCYEDIPNTHAEAGGDSQGASHGDVVRMWSIGQWVQADPDPDTEDIYDWITCEVPMANYHRLLFLGSNEPSSCSATDYLLQLLLSRQTAQ